MEALRKKQERLWAKDSPLDNMIPQVDFDNDEYSDEKEN